MKKIFLALIATVSVSIAAPIPCAPIFDASTMTAGGGCTAGGLLFNNFTLTQVSVGGNSGPLSIVAITVGGGNVLFDTNPNQGNGTFSQRNILTFTVSVLDPAALIIGASSQNGGSGSTSIRQVLCTGPIVFLTGSCSAPPPLMDVTNAGGTSTPTTLFATGTTSLFAWRDINTPVQTTITGTSFDFQVTPEPMAFVMMGTGLCALALIRIRRKAKV